MKKNTKPGGKRAKPKPKPKSKAATASQRPSDHAGTVGAYMTRAVVTVEPETPFKEVCRRMIAQSISCVVVAAGNKPLGLISERAVVRRLAGGKRMEVSARRAMSAPLLTCSPRVSLAGALQKMRENHIRRLAVTEHGKLAGIITQSDLLEASNRQLAALTQEHSRLRLTAMRDELTSLYNRRTFNEFFKEELERVRRYGGLAALVLFDLDHFKLVNDRHGHDAGDTVLRRFADVLKKCCREVDVPARYGGEEFTVLLPAAGTRAGRIFAERVRRETAAMKVRAGGKPVPVTVSAGVCKFTKRYGSMRAMLQQADQAMYRAKHGGRDRVCVAR